MGITELVVPVVVVDKLELVVIIVIFAVVELEIGKVLFCNGIELQYGMLFNQRISPVQLHGSETVAEPENPDLQTHLLLIHSENNK